MKILLVSIMLMAATMSTEKVETVEPQRLVVIEETEDSIILGPAEEEKKETRLYSEYEMELQYNSRTNEW
jgi:hypothetical protein